MSESKILKLEELVRGGDFKTAKRLLSEINPADVGNQQAVRLANIANRVEMSRLSLRILAPFVRPQHANAPKPSDQAKLEYAEALRRNGLVDEARQMFASMDAQLHPIALLRSALCYFQEWRYGEAIPQLQKLIQAVPGDQYLCRIAKVNLAAALIAEKQEDEALKLLGPLCMETKAASQNLLLGNCLELRAQIHLGRSDWTRTESDLQEAMNVASDTNTRYALYIRKWQAIAKSLKLNTVQPELYHCRDEAAQTRDWETVRDCDLYLGLISADQALLQRVYFGTPYASYRRRILDLAAERLTLPNEFLWTFGKSRAVATVDPTRGLAGLKVGSVLHRLLLLLCQDFYRPLATGAVFSNLFQGEHFEQQGSSHRVFNSVSRLRGWLETHLPGIQITEHGGEYSLSGDGSVQIHLCREQIPLKAVVWNDLTLKMNRKPLFSKRDIMAARGCSSAQAKRLLRFAVDSGEIVSIGGGTQTRYRQAA